MPTPITASTLSALLSAALAQKPTRPLVLALDGRCGSGKTTLANGLAAQFPGCTLLRTDDFYLPPARRSPDWAHTPCANMDLSRLRDEALRPAYAGQPVAYRAYSCREGAFLPPAQLPAQPLVILEGSYSHHPLLRPYETLRVFVTWAHATRILPPGGCRWRKGILRSTALRKRRILWWRTPKAGRFRMRAALLCA